MEIIVIILVIISLALNVYLIYEKNKPKKITLDEASKKKQERITKAFNNLMEYDYDVAMKDGARSE